MPLHFVLDGEPGSLRDTAAGDAVTLRGPEAHHAAVVRRVRPGEEITVGDGRGVWLHGACESARPDEVVVRIAARRDVAPAVPRLVLVQALAKGDRDELAVQAATELGVDEIVPWQAERSVSRWDRAKAVKGRARWASIAREAGKQAHRPWLPEVGDLPSTAALLARIGRSRTVVLEPTAPVRATSLRLDAADSRDVLLVVGPEGGISPAEAHAFVAAGAELVALGETVLRTSTAGPAAIVVASIALARW